MVYYKETYTLPSYYNLECNESRMYVLCSLVALMTYFVHAFFNNFLDIDKVSIALWSYIAIIVSVDLSINKISRP